MENKQKVASALASVAAFGNVVFFTAGFASDETSLIPLVANIESSNKRLYKELLPLNLNETSLSKDKDKLIEFSNHEAKRKIIKRLKTIAKRARSNPKRTYLIRLRICGVYASSSVEEQAARLAFIIRTLKVDLMSLMRISLVGHSQGGVVNLAAATIVGSLIYQLISVSTPYRDVQAFKDLYAIALLGQVRQDAFAGFYQRLIGEIPQEAMNNLSKNSLRYLTFVYSTRIKNRFYRLKKRPLLHVIVGISGLYEENIFGVKRSFDGFITGSEQQDVKYDDRVVLTVEDLPCHKNVFPAPNVNDSCFFCSSCEMPVARALDTVREIARGVKPLQIIEDIVEGGNDARFKLPRRFPKDDHHFYHVFYNMYSAPTSHSGIIENNKTAEAIRRWLEVKQL